MDMEWPNIRHPTRFKIGGISIEVLAYVNLSKNQAAKIATQFYHFQNFKKTDKGKIFTVVTTIYENSVGLY